MKTNLLLLAALLSRLAAATAADFGDLYDNATLTKWQASFREDLTAIFREDLFKYLTGEEKRRLGAVHIEVPLRGKDRGLFEFYAADNTVVMPTLGLRFFGDLALASAWLEANGYNGQTVQQYVGMIHYRPASHFPGGRYPRPLDALQIPANARDNATTMSILSQAFTSGMVFILCHELGHVYYRHPGYKGVPYAQARTNEAQADQFAIEIMRRAGQQPMGAVLWFFNAACVEPHRTDFASEESWQTNLLARTHPLTAERIEFLADAIEKAAPDFAVLQNDPRRIQALLRKNAADIRTIGLHLNDEGVHQLFRQQSATTELEMLAPRRGVAFAVKGPKESFKDIPFNGVFACTFGSSVSKQSIDLQLVLRRTGKSVKGDYTYGLAAGQIDGLLQDDTLEFDWTEGASVGKGRFTWKSDKSFTGTWGNRFSREDGGTWNGKRE